MISLDTNILFFSLAPESSRHDLSNDYIRRLTLEKAPVAICELVLAELYGLLRNPKVMLQPLSAPKACDIIDRYRRHPVWCLVENAPVIRYYDRNELPGNLVPPGKSR